MKYNSEIYNRKSIRLKNYNYSKQGIYFITICIENREQLLGEIENNIMKLNEYGKIVKNEWINLEDEKIRLYEFCIMPNHFHGIVEITENTGAIHELPLQENEYKERRKMSIPKLIGKFKMLSSKKINILRNCEGSKIWQRNYYDHIIRNEEEYLKISEYIENNPILWMNDKYFE